MQLLKQKKEATASFFYNKLRNSIAAGLPHVQTTIDRKIGTSGITTLV